MSVCFIAHLRDGVITLPPGVDLGSLTEGAVEVTLNPPSDAGAETGAADGRPPRLGRRSSAHVPTPSLTERGRQQLRELKQTRAAAREAAAA